MLHIAAKNFSRRGYDIVPLSPTAMAAEGLRAKGLTKASTIDHFLIKQTPKNKRAKFFIIDEASMLGSKNLQQIVKRTTRADKVLLIGDSKQHQSLAAGGVFSKFQQHQLIRTERMAGNVRQEGAWPFMRQAVAHLAAKRVSEAFEILDKHGRVRQITEDAERLATVAEKYLQISDKDATLVITQTNHERQQLNLLIRDRLMEAGRVEGQGIKVWT